MLADIFENTLAAVACVVYSVGEEPNFSLFLLGLAEFEEIFSKLRQIFSAVEFEPFKASFFIKFDKAAHSLRAEHLEV